jgi:hypothetical protein
LFTGRKCCRALKACGRSWREGGNIAVRHCNCLRGGRRGGGVEEGNTRETQEEERRERKYKKGKQAEKQRNKARKTEKNKQSPIQLTESNTNT